MSYYPLTIQQMNPDTEEWTDYLSLHAMSVNQAQSFGWGDREEVAAGTEQFHMRFKFELRYCKALEEAVHQPQLYRIIYKGRWYNIQGYDDFMEQNRTVKLIGEAYG